MEQISGFHLGKYYFNQVQLIYQLVGINKVQFNEKN